MSERGGNMGLMARLFDGHDRHGSDENVVVRHRGNFRFNTISALAIVVFLGLGIGLQVTFGDLPANEDIAMSAAGVLVVAGLLFIVPYWAVVVVAIAATWATLPILFDADL